MKAKTSGWTGLFLFIILFIVSSFVAGFAATFLGLTEAWLIFIINAVILFLLLRFTGFFKRHRK